MFENTEEHDNKVYISILHHLLTTKQNKLNILAYGT